MAEEIRLGKTTADWVVGATQEVPLCRLDTDGTTLTGEAVLSLNLGMRVPAGAFVTLWRNSPESVFYVVSAECP